MNLKVAHLVSIQFGIFIGIVSCLVFFRSEYARPRAAAEMREFVTELTAAVKDQRADMADYRAEPEPPEPVTEQPAPALPNEYSPEAVERYRAEATRLYYEQIAPRRNVSASPANSSIAAVAPAYTEVAQEPATVEIDDPAPQTVAYIQPTQVIVYPPPAQFVVFSHPRRFVNRCRPTPHPGALASNPNPRPHNRGTHLSGSPAFRPAGSFGVVHRRNAGAPSCPPTQGFASRGKR